ncbi:hypothetical protein PRIPAC_94800 [Pristionchus pacificus]|uniref:Uncharacterized protein n=1 Tax=Pristionchus pacificus TaxID=54126 RepID=A0A454XPG2_PRIPA|nr:hypothetical protein PRIPAC_94800 [Pristionchus pacificus]|eukprot:PDM76046.1 hypothetical protein PRIPAC_39650 [Pristionchus pacificus]
MSSCFGNCCTSSPSHPARNQIAPQAVPISVIEEQTVFRDQLELAGINPTIDASKGSEMVELRGAGPVIIQQPLSTFNANHTGLAAPSINPSYVAFNGNELGVPDVTVTMPSAPNTPASSSSSRDDAHCPKHSRILLYTYLKAYSRATE